jgi:hypothetical protein
MICVYINYPNPHFTIHRDASCNLIQMHKSPEQRYLRVNRANLGPQLHQFVVGQLRFAAERRLNDMWLEIDLDTPEQEFGLVHVLQALVGQRYTPLAAAPIDTHC